jgi:hypothetical protein
VKAKGKKGAKQTTYRWEYELNEQTQITDLETGHN